MDLKRLWSKSFGVRRGLLAVFLALHLTVMFLNNLPWSSLVAATFPIYHPYLVMTGTEQNGWGMYSAVHHTDNHYKLTGAYDDASTVDIAFPGQTVPGVLANRWRDFVEERQARFLEAMSLEASDDVRNAFEKYLCSKDPSLSSVTLSIISEDTPAIEDWTSPATVDDYASSQDFTVSCTDDV